MSEEITNADKLSCAKRELSMRRRVYGRWVSQQRITQAKADYEIAVMAAIVADYEAMAEADSAKGRLL